MGDKNYHLSEEEFNSAVSVPLRTAESELERMLLYIVNNDSAKINYYNSCQKIKNPNPYETILRTIGETMGLRNADAKQSIQ